MATSTSSKQNYTTEIMRITRLHQKWRYSCIQLAHINNTIAETEVRYHREERRAQRHCLRVKLYSLRASRNMCYEYAKDNEEKLKTMQMEFYTRTGIKWSQALDTETDAIEGLHAGFNTENPQHQQPGDD